MSGHRYKFFIPPVIIFALVFSSFAFIPTKKAQAEDVVGPFMASVAASVLACWAASYFYTPGSLTQVPVDTKTQNGKTCSADTIANSLAKAMIQSLTTSIVNWIKAGGPDGGPLFARDLNKTMENIADGEMGNFVNSIAGLNLCSLGNLQLLFTVDAPAASAAAKYQCTLTGAIANIEAFQNNFEKGGWIGYRRLTQAKNNPIGGYMLASADVSTRIAKEQNRTQVELSWGRGFLPAKNSLGLTITPGAAIETQLSGMLGTDLKQLELGNSINQITAAIVGALMKNAVDKLKTVF